MSEWEGKGKRSSLLDISLKVPTQSLLQILHPSLEFNRSVDIRAALWGKSQLTGSHGDRRIPKYIRDRNSDEIHCVFTDLRHKYRY